MTLDSVRVTNNVIESGWNVAFVSGESRLSISNSVVANNVNLETGITASEFAVATVETTEFSSNLGVAPNVSSIAFAISDSQIELQSVTLADNTNFTVSEVNTIPAFRSSR